jgi:hypothetical protein
LFTHFGGSYLYMILKRNSFIKKVMMYVLLWIYVLNQARNFSISRCWTKITYMVYCQNGLVLSFFFYRSKSFSISSNLLQIMENQAMLYNFKIINFPNMCSNIPASPAYGVYISQLIRYARASSNYSDFLKRHLLRHTLRKKKLLTF